IVPGLWLWRQRHWEWREGDDWEPEVSSFVVESGGEVILIDPLAPPPIAGAEVYRRLEATPPTAIVILKPDHVRDVDQFAHWYGIPARGPWLFWGGEAPRTELQPIFPDEVLPGGLVAQFDGRGGLERPLYLPEQRALVFADGMAAHEAGGGLLRVWWTPILEKRVMPALRAMLELPFELVLVSHGQPVHTRADFEAALTTREPWSRPDEA
ncbi:MAG TPA: MBL fold metallo-hydrolase, partial [Candidatus Dormibacteraeota bacterium]|nr:MBL fold metallo-hydrolase [Candidatus Dormibacteraeota bacterium]